MRLCVVFVLFGLGSLLGANPWVMFSDSTDTYIYNQITGEIYVRFRKGGRNYEDLFVKMPQGVNPETKSAAGSTSSKAELSGAFQGQGKEVEGLLRKAQEIRGQAYSTGME